MNIFEKGYYTIGRNEALEHEKLIDKRVITASKNPHPENIAVALLEFCAELDINYNDSQYSRQDKEMDTRYFSLIGDLVKEDKEYESIGLKNYINKVIEGPLLALFNEKLFPDRPLTVDELDSLVVRYRGREDYNTDYTFSTFAKTRHSEFFFSPAELAPLSEDLECFLKSTKEKKHNSSAEDENEQYWARLYFEAEICRRLLLPTLHECMDKTEDESTFLLAIDGLRSAARILMLIPYARRCKTALSQTARVYGNDFKKLNFFISVIPLYAYKDAKIKDNKTMELFLNCLYLDLLHSSKRNIGTLTRSRMIALLSARKFKSLDIRLGTAFVISFITAFLRTYDCVIENS